MAKRYVVWFVCVKSVVIDVGLWLSVLECAFQSALRGVHVRRLVSRIDRVETMYVTCRS
jgi:hypothetical protein